jgi:2OG-Fe(II) oxygenase superfamily
MSDAGEGAGGETVFSEAWPPGLDASERKPLSAALNELRASGDAAAAGITKGSWEEKMVAICRTKLSVRPKRGRAVLFYSQFPNGKSDRMSLHGGCPVLNDKPKWAANLWVWNT